jgi:enoyl-CoA hydratase/carnithine racemase
MTAVLYEREGPITTITLNRSETRNRIDAELFGGLSSALVNFRDDPEALVAIVTASGEAFSDGAHHEKLLIPWADGSLQVPPNITRGLEIWRRTSAFPKTRNGP